MRRCLYILFSVCLLAWAPLIGQARDASLRFSFYNDSIELPLGTCAIPAFDDSLSESAVQLFRNSISQQNLDPLIKKLQYYRAHYDMDDWVFYHLIRRTAQQTCPKDQNYYRYTLYKWYLLSQSGFQATLGITGQHLLFYVQSDDNIFDIPFYTSIGKQFVCLNYHDYGRKADLDNIKLVHLPTNGDARYKPFSYKLTHFPDFQEESYSDKRLTFTYDNTDYRLNIKVNNAIRDLYANYPVTDYKQFFDVPLSPATYNSLVPQLKQYTRNLTTHQGIELLMHFTRYAFPYQSDNAAYGKEKRLLPEQTLGYDQSDCEDRAALFFYLVKEIYKLPMVVVEYPTHVTIAIRFKKPIGTPVIYNGYSYTICEPTPQVTDLPVGTVADELKHTPYTIAYTYVP